jgi:hypothetical protein
VKPPMSWVRSGPAAITAMCLMLALLAGACGSQSGASSSSSTLTAPRTQASNGIAAKPPARILSAAKAALASVTSVHMRGTVMTSGRRFTLDVIMTKTGAKGSMTGPLAGVKRASFDFVSTAGKIYIRSSTLWRKVGGQAAATLLNNRWVLMPSKAIRSFPFANAKTFARLLTTGRRDKARSVGKATVIDGQPAIPVRTRDSIVYVATTGKPYPLRVRPSASRFGTGRVDFVGYGAPVAITAPKGALDFSKMRG